MRAIPSLSSLRGRHRSRNARADQSRAGVPPRSTPVVDCAVYINGERRPGQWTHTEAVETVRQQGEGFVWISLYEPDAQEIQDIATTFGLHELAVEDAVHAHQRPKLEHYGNTLFLVFRTIRYVEHKSPTTADDIVELGELMVFLGADFLITVRHGHGSGPRDRATSSIPIRRIWPQAPLRCCMRSPTRLSTISSKSPHASRKTSTSWRPRCSLHSRR